MISSTNKEMNSERSERRQGMSQTRLIIMVIKKDKNTLAANQKPVLRTKSPISLYG